MKAMRGLLFLCLSVGYGTSFAQGGSTADPQVVGVWRGHSVCMVKDSPCHDEVNVYRISAIAGKPRIYFVSGNKIVDGREQVMGTGEWKYDVNTHELVHKFANGIFRLEVKGEKMEGDLKLPQGTLYRRIFLQREK
jgi:hypothetical protein